MTLADDLSLALRLADAADIISGADFTGSALAHRLKADGSPVSDTDEAVERRVREILAAERPADGMLGEEVGESGPAGRRWIVDGIDGTILFVAGQRGWSTQIALEVDGEPVIGVTTSGADGRRWWAARGGGAWYAVRGGPAERLAVSDRRVIDGADARYTLIPPLEVLDPVAGDVIDVAASGVDVEYVPPREHGALFVADGRVEVCVQLGGGPWDFAALSVLVEEAGGRFSDLAGRRDVYGGGPVVFSNGHVHDDVLALLAR
jgi:histidinol-phosphatase